MFPYNYVLGYNDLNRVPGYFRLCAVPIPDAPLSESPFSKRRHIGDPADASAYDAQTLLFDWKLRTFWIPVAEAI